METCRKRVWLALALLILRPVAQADIAEPPDVAALDAAFQQLSHDVYRQLAQQEKYQAGNADALMTQAQLRLSQGQHVSAIALIAISAIALTCWPCDNRNCACVINASALPA